MPLNTPLSTLLRMLKAAIGDSLVVGTQADATYRQLLADKQQWLAGVYDFPMLKDRWDVTILPSQRFYDFPTTSIDGTAGITIDFNRPWKAFVNWTNYWIPVDFGVDEIQEFNAMNPDTNNVVWPQVRNDPVRRWEFNGENQFQVWPVPVTQQVFRFVGQRNLDPLVVDTDTSDLDDEFLVYSVAVDILMRKKSADAQSRLSQAQERIRSFRAVLPTRTRDVCIGGNSFSKHWKKLVPVVGVAGGGSGNGGDSNDGNVIGIG